MKALGTQRLAEARVLVGVGGAAGEADALLADGRVASWPAASRSAAGAGAAGVHGSEARGGERDEHERMLRDSVGDALAASEAGAISW